MESQLCIFCNWKLGPLISYLDFLRNLDHNIIRVYVDKRYLTSKNNPGFDQTHCDYLEKEIIPNYDVKLHGEPFENLPSLPDIIFEDRKFLKNRPDFFFSRRQKEMKVHLLEGLKIDHRKLLVHEIGYYPWHKTFHLGRGGVFSESRLYKLTENDLKDQPVYEEKIEGGIKDLNWGGSKDISMFGGSFAYVPLQTTDEHKRNMYSRYEQNNQKFVEFVDDIVPDEYTLLIKEHPAMPPEKYVQYGSLSKRCLNVSNLNFSVHDLINESEFVVAINTTTVVEAIAMGKKVFSYGDEVFCNKGLTYHKVYNSRKFYRAIDKPLPNLKKNNINKKFISALIDRCVIRQKTDDPSYVKNHFWNSELHKPEEN